MAEAVVCQAEDFSQWRKCSRALLASGTPPDAVHWVASDGASQTLFGGEDLPALTATATFSVSAELLGLLQTAACFRCPDRWAFLYKVLWRWAQGERSVVSAADVDGARLHAMVKAVRREIHDMHAYLRFREVRCAAAHEGPQYVAWFEPEHDVLPQVAEHFAKRMGRVRWAIATPSAAVMWDGHLLHFGPGGPKPEQSDQETDAGEALWLTYYRNTFNPSRLNVSVMQSHMPKRFWKNLPEAPLIPAMVAEAAAGARRLGQSQDVGDKVLAGQGAVVTITREQAQPNRPTPHKLDECRRCDLWRNATHGVAGVGPQDAKIMIVGEQPGDQEDLQGAPFVGPAGKVLDQALAQAGVAREQVFVTNAVKHFKWEPRGKRRLHKTPAQQEIEACHHWLQSELDASQARVVVVLGATALKSVLQVKSVALGKVLGAVLEHEGRRVIASYHPSYVLRIKDDAQQQEALEHIVAALRHAQQLVSAGE